MREPTIEELLADEMMVAVLRSAGLGPRQFAAQLSELSDRLWGGRRPDAPAARSERSAPRCLECC